MTSIGDVMRHMHPPVEMSPLPAPPRPEGGYPVPVLPDDLREQVGLLEGRHRFGDFVMSPRDGKPVFDARAAGYAEQQRLAMQPATKLEIRRWFTVLVNVLVPGAIKPQALFQGLLLVCGKYPAACFCDETAAAIIGENTFLPSVAEMRAVLRPISEELKGTLRGLEKIQEAGTAQRGRSDWRASTAYIDGIVASGSAAVPPKHPPHPSMPKREPVSDLVRIDPTKVAQQLAAFGFQPGGPDLLAARREALKPKPPAPPPEGQAPLLKVVK